MSCPICSHTELEAGAENCPQCGSDLEIFTHIESARKESSFQKKAGLMLTAFLGLVLVGWGSTSFFSGNKTEISGELAVAETTDVVTLPEDPLSLNASTKPVEEFVKGTDNEEVKPEITPLVAENKVAKELPALAAKAPVVKEKVKPAASSNEGGVIIHKVRRGDSFWKISKKYFGNGNHAKQIAKDNNLNAKKNIPLGTKLKINK